MTSACVLDASAALALLAPSQATAAARAFATALPGVLVAPSIFPIEVRHGVLKLERRGLLVIGTADTQLAELEQIIEVEPVPEASDLVRLVASARREMLGLYETLYVDLAVQRGAALASRDGTMLAAAGRRAVTTIDLR